MEVESSKPLSSFEEYKISKELSRYKLLAQKLSQQIENLAEDENTRQRWIWELIQNAKDVPNQFGKVKIRIEVGDKRFRFSHNGDPFRTSDLESIVSQYSSKDEKNADQVETTGKYGTGFITTYILSRIVKVKGLIKVVGNLKDLRPEESSSSDSDDERARKKPMKTMESLDESFMQQNPQFGRFKTEESETEKILNQMNTSVLQNISTVEVNNEPSLLNQSDASSKFFQQFNIKLDRSYNDRDNEFLKKLMKTQNKIMSDLEKLELKEYWERQENDLDTTFSYENLDQAAFSMIEKGIQSLKDLFPYALLFNSKLYQIEVIDKRTVKKFKDFAFRKEKQKNINKVIKVFNCSYKQEEQGVKILSFAYKEDKSTQSIVAIPIQVENKDITILEIKEGIPKVFKEFPLIGCSNTGFNFAYTSRKFYPNETRSELLLKTIEGRATFKAEQNWVCLNAIFPLAKELLILMSTRAVKGVENYLLMQEENYYTQFEDKNFKRHLLDFKKDIFDLDMVPMQDGQRRKLKDLIFLMDQSPTSKQIEKKNFGSLLNEKFKFLFGTDRTLSEKVYLQFYEKMRIYKTHISNIVNFVDFEGCLRKFCQKSFQQYAGIWENEKYALEQIKSIYDFIRSYKTNFMNMVTGYSQYPFILTNKKQFRKMKGDDCGKLMVKADLPVAYQDIASFLKIDYNKNLVHEDLKEYMVKPETFGIKEMEALFRKKFTLQVNEDVTKSFMSNLGDFLCTYQIGEEILELARQTKDYSGIQKFRVEQKELKRMSKNQENYYEQLFKIQFLQWVNGVLSSCSNLSNLGSSYLKNGVNTMEWLNKVLRMSLNHYQQPIKYSLAWDETFKEFHQLIKLKEDYPTETDVKFYEWTRYEYNRKIDSRYQKSLPTLKSQLAHPNLEIEPNTKKSYADVFGFARNLYSDLSEAKKLDFLNYVDKIYNEHKKKPDYQFARQKSDTFSEIIKRRLKCLVEITDNLKQDEKDFLYDMIRNKGEMQYARELYALDSFKTVYIAYKELKDSNAKEDQMDEDSDQD